MKEQPLNPPNTISLDDAKMYTKEWRLFLRDAFHPHPSEESILRAFYIPISDIINLADTHKAEGVRAYLCMDRTPDVVPSRIWVIMVPVKDGKDIINELPNGADGDGGTDPNTTIYDFTQPCPAQCDPQSPLY